jgi:DNA primase
MEIIKIKKQLPMLTVLSNYGIKPDKNNHIRCPFHEVDKPSMKIYPKTGTYHCFGCGKSGDKIQWNLKPFQIQPLHEYLFTKRNF